MIATRRQVLYAVGLALLAVADIPEGGAGSGWMTLAALIAVAATLGRHRYPTAMVMVGFGTLFAADVMSVVEQQTANPTFGHTLTLGVLVYALCRGAAWPAVIVALMLCASSTVLGEVLTYGSDWGLKFDDLSVWVIGAVAGIALRYRAALVLSRSDQVRSEERARIARDLHDVVAHHVSAISLHAEGAAAVLETDPDSARTALGSIHAAAGLTLTEMRRMVAALRDDDASGERSPNASINELSALLNDPPHPLAVTVEVSGDVVDVPAYTTSAVLRIAQEAVTNARRHSREASGIVVSINRAADVVTLVVDDDGEHHLPPSGAGYGIRGMAERAVLLGGTLSAEPLDQRGWRVRASLPLGGGS